MIIFEEAILAYKIKIDEDGHYIIVINDMIETDLGTDETVAKRKVATLVAGLTQATDTILSGMLDAYSEAKA